MMIARHYESAPITEAIIDLRVDPRSDIERRDLEEVVGGLSDIYPQRELIYEAIGRFHLTPGTAASASAEQDCTGYKFVSKEGKYIWQSRRDGFTFSRLAPYESWEPFRSEARRIWNLYRDRVAPNSIRRLALRYINRIDIPATVVDSSKRTLELSDFLRTGPEVSPDLPSLSAFFMQIRLVQDDIGANLLINQTNTKPPQDDTISILLDIDLFRDAQVPQAEEDIWEYFEQLHDRKNQVFEACITNKTRELFSPCP